MRATVSRKQRKPGTSKLKLPASANREQLDGASSHFCGPEAAPGAVFAQIPLR
jgi:hypothetical protein